LVRNLRRTSDQVLTDRRGLATTIDVTAPAQNARMPFSITSTRPLKALHWKVSGSTFPHATLRLTGPLGGTHWASTPIGPGAGSGTLSPPLSVKGGWQLILDPDDRATGKATITFTAVNV
jgi:hypothetical protein